MSMVGFSPDTISASTLAVIGAPVSNDRMRSRIGCAMARSVACRGSGPSPKDMLGSVGVGVPTVQHLFGGGTLRGDREVARVTGE